MDTRQLLSADGQVLLALCSTLGGNDETAAEPFKLAEWNELERRISQSALRSPAALANQPIDELTRALVLRRDESERMALLLERSSRIALELDSLFSRGMWVITRADEAYPRELKAKLKRHAPTVLYGAGNLDLLGKGGIAIVGSRNIDEAAVGFAEMVGRKCAAANVPVVSGGARGSDRVGMQAALAADGQACGVLADSLERTARQPDVGEFLSDGRLLLLTPYVPSSGFSVGAAMGRNKIIYGLAEFGVVVSSERETGGTWAGATEALKAGWCPVFVRESAGAPEGNRALLKAGAIPIMESDLKDVPSLPDWLRQRVPRTVVEQDLFAS